MTDVTGMFFGCSSLTSIPQLDTSNVGIMQNLFYNCSSLQSLPLLDTSNVTYAGGMFNVPNSSNETPYPDLTDLGGFKNLKVSLNLSGMPNLTPQSLINVINKLYNFKSHGVTTTQTLTLGTTNLNKLSDIYISIATDKGWVLE